MGSSPTRPPCQQLLALLENDAEGHCHATRHPENKPNCRRWDGGGGGSQACRLRDCTFRTILLPSTGGPLWVRCASLSVGTGVVFTSKEKSRAVCIFCSWEKL